MTTEYGIAPVLVQHETELVIDLAAFRGAPTLLLFWSPGCTHCQHLLPESNAFERPAARPRLVIVSRGPVALNQEAGFASSLILDEDRSIAHTFGITGTPAAVLIDGRGVVATQVARGADGVHSALQALQSAYAPASAAG